MGARVARAQVGTGQLWLAQGASLNHPTEIGFHPKSNVL